MLAVHARSTTPTLVEIFLDRTPFYAESRWPGRRHRHDRHRDRSRPRCSTRRSRCPDLRRHIGAHHRRHDHRRARRRRRRSTSNAATRSAATTPARTCCTTRCAGCSASTSSRPARCVGPDRLRFDFSPLRRRSPTSRSPRSSGWPTPRRCANAPARVFETTKDEAEALGAIAFFGDKYGDIVRVLEAGAVDRAVRRHARRAPPATSD